MQPLISALGNCLLPVALLSCGAWVADCAVTGAPSARRVNLLLPATQAHQIRGEQEVMPTPPSDAQPIGRLHAPRLGASRMVLAGAGLPKPASGPGRLFLSPYRSETGTVVLLAETESAPGFISRFGNGDPLLLELVNGSRTLFRVTRVRTVPDPVLQIPETGPGPALMLVTRLGAPEPGGMPQFYIVIARPAAVETPL